MTIIDLVSVAAHYASLFACISFLTEKNNRNEDIAVLAGVAFSSATFIMMQIMRVLTFRDGVPIDPSAHDSLIAGFFLLNGIIFLCVALVLRRHRSRRGT